MAIAFDNKTNGNSAGTPSSLTFSHTITGLNPFLIVAAGVQDSGAVNISTITYNGVALTKVGNNLTGPSGYRSSLWYLKAPATGAHNVVVTASSNVTSALSAEAVSYTGVDQATPLDASNTGSGNSTSVSASITTVQNNCWAVLLLGVDTSATASTNSTLRANGIVNGNGVAIFDSNGAITPAGAFNMSVTFNSQAYAYEILSMTPGIGFSASDTQGSTDVASLNNNSLTASDTQGSTDIALAKYSWGNQSRSNTTWTTQPKS